MWKGSILYDSNCLTFWKRQNYGGNKKVSGCQVWCEGRRDEQAEHRGLFRAVKILWYNDDGYSVYVIIHLSKPMEHIKGFPGGSDSKASAWSAGDLGSIPGLGRSPREENGTPLQCSCLENPMGRGTWWAAVHGVAKSQTPLSDFTFTFTMEHITSRVNPRVHYRILVNCDVSV